MITSLLNLLIELDCGINYCRILRHFLLSLNKFRSLNRTTHWRNHVRSALDLLFDVLLNLLELLLLLMTHLHLYDPSAASSLVPVSFLCKCVNMITYIFEYGLSLPVHLLLCLNLNAVAKLRLFQHQTLLLLWLLLLVNFVRGLWPRSLCYFWLIIPSAITWRYEPENTRTICRNCFNSLPRFLRLSFLRRLSVFVSSRVLPSSRRILSCDCSCRYTH